MLATDDTIAAISSPPGRGYRALLRISGPSAIGVLQRLSRLDPPTPRTLSPVALRWRRGLHLPALAVVYRAPHSYTGDDLVEFQFTGHPSLAQRLLAAVLSAGPEGPSVRAAEPGEFTFRAFARGKLDLTRAEGVAATIAATSDAQLRAAAHLRRGELGELASKVSQALAIQIGLIEAGIDFSDQEDVVAVTPASLHDALRSAMDLLRDTLERSRSWSAVDAPPVVVLIGPPSVGKSTLFNALLGRERSVTHPAPGTTRDVIREPMTIAPVGPSHPGVEVLLTDLAGLDASAEGRGIDAQAQRLVRQAIRSADLALLLRESGSIGDPAWESVLPDGLPVIRVLTKCDRTPGDEPGGIRTSAAVGIGIDLLRRAIAEAIGHSSESVPAQSLVLQPRHESALRLCLERGSAVVASLVDRVGDRTLAHAELIAAELRTALDALACLTGRLTADDILDHVFSRFCIGK